MGEKENTGIMQLNRVYVKGFRNYKEATVNFNKSTLIIGANDVGKTNLIYALQILMDRGFSDYTFDATIGNELHRRA